MKMSYPSDKIANPLEILRKSGYVPFTDPKTHQESFTFKLTPEFYPRFHLYIKQTNEKTIFDLHLDQKKPSYGSSHMHNAEYEGKRIKQELLRIAGWVNYLSK